jgi:hypothetical protein
MLDSYIGSIMNMTADVLIQENRQSQSSGTILREWVYDKTISCKVEPVKAAGSSSRTGGKKFDGGSHNEYEERLYLKMKCLVPFSRRWRVSNIRSSDDQQVFFEIDRYDSPDTIFDVTNSHAVLDPFGKVSYYEVTLQRVHIQNDNTSSK